MKKTCKLCKLEKRLMQFRIYVNNPILETMSFSNHCITCELDNKPGASV